MIKYNQDGKEIWRKSGYGRIQGGRIVIRATPSGSFIITTTSEHNLIKPTVGYTQILTIKINNSGDMIWKNLYGKKAQSWDIIERNQGYVVCGNSYETDLFEGKSVGLIIRMNSDGKIENERRIGGSDLNICKGLLISNNRLYIVGKSTYEESGNSMVKIFIIIDETK